MDHIEVYGVFFFFLSVVLFVSMSCNWNFEVLVVSYETVPFRES